MHIKGESIKFSVAFGSLVYRGSSRRLHDTVQRIYKIQIQTERCTDPMFIFLRLNIPRNEPLDQETDYHQHPFAPKQLYVFFSFLTFL